MTTVYRNLERLCFHETGKVPQWANNRGTVCHNHNLEHYSVNSQAKYITTGAGGMVIIGDEIHHESFKRRNTTKPIMKSLWSKVVTGFTSHVFNDAGNTLTTYYWDVKQNKSIYSFDVTLT